MISRDHLHSLILVPVGELMPRLDPKSRSRLARAIADRLHPVIVEQILREREPMSRLGGYPSSARPVGDLARPPSGPAPGEVDHG